MMIQKVSTKTIVAEVLAYVLAYAGWLLTALLGLVTVFYTRQVFDMLYRVIGIQAGLDPVIINNRLRFFDLAGMLILLLLWASLAFYAEHRYRSSISEAIHRQFKEEVSRSPQTATPQNKHLREYGIDVLFRRFLITTSIPVILFAVAYLIGQITLWSF
jgi:hypothetical protein